MSTELNNLGSQIGVNPLLVSVTDAGLKTAGARMRAYIPGLSGLWQALRYHFDVDNTYVKNKMKLLLFPRQRNWTRLASDTVETSRPLPPVADVNAPDLYLPVMSFITFSLFAGFLQGTAGRFDPEYIQATIMWSATLIALEAAAARLACMFLKVPNISLLDFVCYSGYRYFGLCIILLVELITKGMHLPYYIILGIVGAGNSLFLFQTLRASIKKARQQDPMVNDVSVSCCFVTCVHTCFCCSHANFHHCFATFACAERSNVVGNCNCSSAVLIHVVALGLQP